MRNRSRETGHLPRPSADWDRSRSENQDVWRERNAEYDPQNIISTVKHGSGIIMIFPAKGTE